MRAGEMPVGIACLQAAVWPGVLVCRSFSSVATTGADRGDLWLLGLSAMMTGAAGISLSDRSAGAADAVPSRKTDRERAAAAEQHISADPAAAAASGLSTGYMNPRHTHFVGCG